MIGFSLPGLLVGDVMARLGRGPWSLSRFGDTEIACMTGARVKNVDGQPLSAAAAAELWMTLASPGTYSYGLQQLSLDNDLVPRRIRDAVDWIDADVFHRASEAGVLRVFVDWLRIKRVLLVGPERLAPLEFLRTAGHVEIPRKNGYRVKRRALRDTHSLAEGADVVIFCASLLSNVLIHALHPQVGDRVSLIDCGSLWDPYAGFRTRAYHDRLSQDVMLSNLGEDTWTFRSLPQPATGP